MKEINLEKYLRDLFEQKRKERREKEQLRLEGVDHVEDYLRAVELMLKLEKTLSEEQKDLFKKINFYNFRYNEECELLAFKSGYMTALEHNEKKSKKKGY